MEMSQMMIQSTMTGVCSLTMTHQPRKLQCPAIHAKHASQSLNLDTAKAAGKLEKNGSEATKENSKTGTKILLTNPKNQLK